MSEPKDPDPRLETLVVRGVLPLNEQARVRMLTLLETFPLTDARRELETIIRGGPGGGGSISLVGSVGF